MRLYTPKKPVKVAMLDSGINSAMSVFKKSSIISYNAINHDTTTTDSLGHGTAIASVIIADKNKQTIQA
ncbi:S8 family serine peptidase [Bacillus sp. YC2]|uniref:S8 family serine peptidase n=1 Tax=Bacillus sp. YC2 TaxID=2861287 RepID=UPI0037C18EAB